MAKDVLSNLDFKGTAKAVNLPDPSAAQDAATKAYVDAAIEGVNWKDSVRVKTTANLNLASPGATIDGITMSAGDRVLVGSQTAPAENGIYIWSGAAVAATRAADASTAVELEQAICAVEEGTSAGTSWRQTSVNFVLGSGAVAWTSFGVVSPPATVTTPGIVELATQGEVDTGTDADRVVTPATLAGWAGRKLKATANIGDGSATQYVVTHNFNTYDVQVEVFRNSGARDTVLCDVERSSVNAVTLTFATAPTSNQFRIVVLG